MNDDAKRQLLSDHLPYELLMLRYAYREIQTAQPALRWNALFESFAAHARAIHEFLTGKADNRNGHSSDFVANFKCDKPDLVRGKMAALNQQVLHLGTMRTAKKDDKVDLSDAIVIYDWIEANVPRFLAELPDDFKPYWQPDRSALENVDTTSLITPIGPSATNHILIVQSTAA